MNDEKERGFWKELSLLQEAVDKFDDISFKIKNWFITIFIAITGYAIAKSEPDLLLLNFLVIPIFYFYEITYRIPLGAFLKRSRNIQEILRGEKVPEESDFSPNVDKFLLDVSQVDMTSTLLRIFLRLGISEDRAKRNVVECREIRKRFYTQLFQLRVSLIYLAALLANTIALILL